jgi:site-specific DNA-methyltransferase (adenine-specific)
MPPVALPQVEPAPELAHELTFDDGRSARLMRSDALGLLRSLPDASVDLIVTDPAYNGMNRHLMLGKGRIVGKYQQRGDGERWFDEFDDSPENYATFCAEVARVLGPDRAAFLMFDAYSMLTLGSIVREHFHVKNVITWDKVAIGMGHHFRRQSEFVLYVTTGKAKLSRRDVSDVWRIRRVHRAGYPTQKPIELFEAMIAASIGPRAASDIVVCDPFLGSGSAAVAALRQGCSFVGGDVAEASLVAAHSRIEALRVGAPDPLQSKPCVDVALQKPFWLDTRVEGD